MMAAHFLERCTMMTAARLFDNSAHADQFLSSLGVLASVSKRHRADGKVALSWRPLTLRLITRNGQVVEGRPAPVMREVDHAYIVRDEAGKAQKVNRYTLMSGANRFEIC
jgi:hypothetical protein